MKTLKKGCFCLHASNDDVHLLDYQHSSLHFIPSDVFHHERTLEELYVNSNQIRELPRELFCCHGLRLLNVSDNDLTMIPPAVASLHNLEHLDISKNGVADIPDNIKFCKLMRILEAGVNPLGKLPESITQLNNMTELYLNDAVLKVLPGSLGRLSKLKVLDVRENHLKTLPGSMSHMTLLERLDIGNNQLTELVEVVGSLSSLKELWCDQNQIKALPSSLGNLKKLLFLDATKNRIEVMPAEIEGCQAITDLHLSINLLPKLPETIGRLTNLATLNVDDNRLTSLPFSIGGLVSLSELNISANDLESLPSSMGLLRHLRTLYADENFLMSIPPEIGSCSGLTVLSLRSNNLTYVPADVGHIRRLRVLNLSDNKLEYLPFSMTRLKELQALWLAENQTKPLVQLQSEVDEETGQRMLTCYLLPQQLAKTKEDPYGDTNSFHPSMWDEERAHRQQIHFELEENEEHEGQLPRSTTPYPKEMRHRIHHRNHIALRQLDDHLRNKGTSQGERDTDKKQRQEQSSNPSQTQPQSAQRSTSQAPQPPPPQGHRAQQVPQDHRVHQVDRVHSAIALNTSAGRNAGQAKSNGGSNDDWLMPLVKRQLASSTPAFPQPDPPWNNSVPDFPASSTSATAASHHSLQQAESSYHSGCSAGVPARRRPASQDISRREGDYAGNSLAATSTSFHSFYGSHQKPPARSASGYHSDMGCRSEPSQRRENKSKHDSRHTANSAPRTLTSLHSLSGGRVTTSGYYSDSRTERGYQSDNGRHRAHRSRKHGDSLTSHKGYTSDFEVERMYSTDRSRVPDNRGSSPAWEAPVQGSAGYSPGFNARDTQRNSQTTSPPHTYRDLQASPQRRPHSMNLIPETSHVSSSPRRKSSANNNNSCIFRTKVTKNPGLGFSISGGIGSAGSQYSPSDQGIFISKVQPTGPGASTLKAGDRILEVNGVSFENFEHVKAVDMLRSSGHSISMLLERRLQHNFTNAAPH